MSIINNMVEAHGFMCTITKNKKSFRVNVRTSYWFYHYVIKKKRTVFFGLYGSFSGGKYAFGISCRKFNRTEIIGPKHYLGFINIEKDLLFVV